MDKRDLRDWVALFFFYSSLAMLLAITLCLGGCSTARLGL